MAADLAIAFRVYPGVSKQPFISVDQKLDLVTLGLESFAAALGGCRPEVWVLLDSCPVEYETRIGEIIGQFRPTFISLENAGNKKSFRHQLDVLLKSTAPVVYFAEDDYVYQPGAFERGLGLFLEAEWADYATLYDHPDLYDGHLHRYRSEVRFAAGCHWRTVASTCLTFFARRSVLNKDRRVFASFARGNYDVSLWQALTRLPAISVRSAVKAAGAGDLQFVKALVKMGLYTPGRWLLGPQRHLWSPVPTLATHMESSRLAPGVDWRARFPAS